MFNLMGKEINAILCAQTILIWTHAIKVDDYNNFDFVSGLQLVKEIHNLPRLRSRKSSCLIAERNG